MPRSGTHLVPWQGHQVPISCTPLTAPTVGASPCLYPAPTLSVWQGHPCVRILNPCCPWQGWLVPVPCTCVTGHSWVHPAPTLLTWQGCPMPVSCTHDGDTPLPVSCTHVAGRSCNPYPCTHLVHGWATPWPYLAAVSLHPSQGHPCAHILHPPCPMSGHPLACILHPSHCTHGGGTPVPVSCTYLVPRRGHPCARILHPPYPCCVGAPTSVS